MFNDKWEEKKPNIMEFTQFLQSVYQEEFLPKVPQITCDYIFRKKEKKKDN
jgi:hypothetical protein